MALLYKKGAWSRGTTEVCDAEGPGIDSPTELGDLRDLRAGQWIC